MAPSQNLKQKVEETAPAKAPMRLQEFLYLCLAHWHWYVISIIVCMAGAFLYLKTTTPTYQRSSSIQIKTDSRGRSATANALMFEDLGLASGSSTISDEVSFFMSPDLMRDVVTSLNLNTTYASKGRFRDMVLYGKTQPVQVKLPEVKDDEFVSFEMKLAKDGEFTLTNFAKSGDDELASHDVKGRIGTPVKTPVGVIDVMPGEAFTGNEDVTIKIAHLPVKIMAAALSGALHAEVEEDAYSVVDLTITDSSAERADDILNELIVCYDKRWLRDQLAQADNSSKFIDERVKLLQQELGSVDNDISSFKSANMIPDVDAAASMYMTQASQASLALKDLRNQEYMAKYIRNYLRNNDNNFKLLPTNAGLSSPSLGTQIAEYNKQVIQRNTLVAQSSASNPLVTDMDQTLLAMRGALLAAIDNEIVSLNEQIKSQEGFSGAASSKIASNPQQAKYLLSVERQQKVKETLYLYLLQKREENQLNQAFSAYQTRIIRQPDGSSAPVAPKRTNIMLEAFALSLILPTLLLYLKENSVHVVRGRKDLKEMRVPLAGELPLHAKKQKLKRPSFGHKEAEPIVAVKENSRNSINEAFRVVRTNVEFMLGSSPSSKVVMLVSANPGSGKTFVSFNLAKSFAIKNKKVVVVDLDMRKASLSKYIADTKTGVSDYLAGRTDDIDSITKQVPDTPNLSLIPVGTIPPNPTELLFNERLHTLIEYLRVHYDYVFIDCPPIEVVADASIVSKYVHNTLFVVRAGLLDLSMLPVIDDLYLNGTYPGMSLILNGTVNPNNRYTRRYGNPYSYGYGYGSGYHTDEDE